MDSKVLEVQEWLNQTYPTYFDSTTGSFPIVMDGITGGTTVKALVMALQIEVGVSPVDGVMGTGTISKCPTINQSSSNALLRIIQGGLFCKGYNAGTFDGIYGNNTRNAIISFKTDAGFTTDDGGVSPMFIKALLNTDPFIMVDGSNSNIRLVQQFLNANYYSLFWSKLGLIPTYGKYERKTNKALIYAIQHEIGATADGAIGSNTYSLLPVLSKESSDSIHIKLLKCALICNGYNVSLNTSYDDELVTALTNFQIFMHLIIDENVTLGSVNRITWGSLLISKGDTTRTANACDCSTRLTPTIAQDLYNDGFRYIGRYLTKVTGGLDKNLTKDEITTILSNGLNIFPIFQEDSSTVEYFSYEQGLVDASKALNAAKSLAIPYDTTIYFAVDCDMTDEQIDNYAMPHFLAIYTYFTEQNSPYKIGIYGSRNVCTRISNAGYAIYSFVSDMSSGYSGNLGYSIPLNWSFEQFNEVSAYPLSSGTIGLDYDIANETDTGITNLNFNSNYIPPYLPTTEEMNAATPIKNLISSIELLEHSYWNFTEGLDYTTFERTRNCCLGVLDYLFQYKYSDWKWDFTTPQQGFFLEWINTSDELNNLFADYITYQKTETSETRATLVSDGSYGLMELAHLAVGIKCYLDSTVPASWSTWAGDLASGINETWINSAQSVDLTTNTDVAFKNIGASEPQVCGIHDARQFNYYDTIADIDAYKIAELITN